MRSRPRCVLVLLAMLGAPTFAGACLWDYDTLRQERARFPLALELITGKFLRHSKEFYEWRIRDRLKRLGADPWNLAYHDDLAVAYSKTGQHAKAVETILAKERIKPGLYETYSNLGTFHVLAGELDKGLPYIDKALAINPDAHFGRERYQKWLAEYALMRMREGKVLFPLQGGTEKQPNQVNNFHGFLKQRLQTERLTVEELQKAVKGILGMMRFADHDNPLLLEALGDLLLSDTRSEDAKQLAARAYLQASYQMPEGFARKDYRDLAEQALDMQTIGPNTTTQLKLPALEKEFKSELAAAEQWYGELKEQELGWIRDGKDVEAEYDRLYTEEPRLPGAPVEDAPGEQFFSFLSENKILAGAVFAALLFAGVVLVMRLRRA